MKYSLLFGLTMYFITGCGDAEESSEKSQVSQSSTQNTSSKKSTSTASSGQKTLSDAEYELLEPYLTDIRAGLREYQPNSIGICKGKSKDCEEFVGLDAGTLPEGTFSIRGEFQAPKLKKGAGWTARVEVNCTITKKTKNSESSTDKTYSKSWDDITHVSESRGHGYRLSPIYTITSPSVRGTEECQYTITAENLDGPTEWKGSYKVPYKG